MAIQVWKQAAEKAGTVDPAKITTILHSGISFKTVLGDVVFDKKGDPVITKKRQYVFYSWNKGDYAEIKRI